MNINTIGVPLLFLIVSTLLLWFIIGSKGHWIFKLFMTAISIYSTFLIWVSLSSLSGWPVCDTLPTKFKLHWGVAKQTDNKKIYIWASELDDHHRAIPTKSGMVKHEAGTPRAYEIPYTPEGHKELNKALEIIKKGGSVVGRGSRGEGEGKEQGEGQSGLKGNGEGKSKGYGEGTNSPDIHFYLLPPAELPKKDVP